MLYSTSLSQVSTRQIRSYVVFYVPVTRFSLVIFLLDCVSGIRSASFPGCLSYHNFAIDLYIFVFSI